MKTLEENVERAKKLRGKKHWVFEHSFDTKECYTIKFLEQKLNYMHNNPVSGKWSLAKTFLDYPHSSTRFYELNERNRINLSHYFSADEYKTTPGPRS